MDDIFKDNPELDEVHKTSDGKYFYIESDARNHASSLEDKHVEKLTRATKVQGKGDNQSKEDNRAEKIAELKALELKKENYNQMKSLVKFFEIKTENQSANALIAALTEFKKEIEGKNE